MRCDEPGWVLIGPVRTRRSLWYRLKPGVGVELCAGREGDDAYAVVECGGAALATLADLLATAEFAATCASEWGNDWCRRCEPEEFEE
jgi:hypothetical protein